MTSDLEAQIISLYAKGMTTRDISEHLKGAYLGVEISPTLISNVTEKISFLMIRSAGQQSKKIPVPIFYLIHLGLSVGATHRDGLRISNDFELRESKPYLLTSYHKILKFPDC